MRATHGDEGEVMHTLTPVGVQSVHDHVISLVAQRWAKSFQCRVTIKPDGGANGWKALDESDPDIIGWQFAPGGNKVEWIAEVETEESLSDPQTRARFQMQSALGVPFYLFVPKGYRRAVQALAMRVGVSFNGIYEYAFTNETFQLS
jgi:hypothetical protein